MQSTQSAQCASAVGFSRNMSNLDVAFSKICPLLAIIPPVYLPSAGNLRSLAGPI